jgi:RNA polymerase sigma factor FliA
VDENDVERLVLEYQGLVRSIAWRIHRVLPAWVEMDDLIGYGNLGLTQAARTFDPGRNWEFSTYAFHRVRGAILDGLKQMSWFRCSDFYRGRYRRAWQTMSEEYGEPSADDTMSAAAEGRPSEQIAESAVPVRLPNPDGQALSQVVDPKAQPADVIVEDADLHRQLRELVEQLPEPLKKLVYTAYYEGCTLKQVGEGLGRDKVWACRMHARAIKQLGGKLRVLQVC